MFIKQGFGNKIYRIIQAFLKELYDWCVNYEQERDNILIEVP